MSCHMYWTFMLIQSVYPVDCSILGVEAPLDAIITTAFGLNPTHVTESDQVADMEKVPTFARTHPDTHELPSQVFSELFCKSNHCIPVNGLSGSCGDTIRPPSEAKR